MSVNELFNREERPPLVRFERRPVEDVAASQREGRYVAKDVDYALVTPPYSKDCIIHKVNNWLENVRKNVRDGRTPQHWLDQWEKAYNAWRNGQEIPLNGTPIKGWGVISPAQQEMIINIGCPTVEMLAAINDEGLKRLGIGSMDLKNKARTWLESMKNHGIVTIQMAAMEQENAVLKASVEALQKQIDGMRALIESSHQEQSEQPQGISAAELLEDDPIPHSAVEVKRTRRARVNA